MKKKMSLTKVSNDQLRESRGGRPYGEICYCQCACPGDEDKNATRSNDSLSIYIRAEYNAEEPDQRPDEPQLGWE